MKRQEKIYLIFSFFYKGLIRLFIQIKMISIQTCNILQVLPLVPPDEGGSPYAGQVFNFCILF